MSRHAGTVLKDCERCGRRYYGLKKNKKGRFCPGCARITAEQTKKGGGLRHANGQLL